MYRSAVQCCFAARRLLFYRDEDSFYLAFVCLFVATNKVLTLIELVHADCLYNALHLHVLRLVFFCYLCFVWRPSANAFTVVVWIQTIRSAAFFPVGVVALAHAFDNSMSDVALINLYWAMVVL